MENLLRKMEEGFSWKRKGKGGCRYSSVIACSGTETFSVGAGGDGDGYCGAELDNLEWSFPSFVSPDLPSF